MIDKQNVDLKSDIVEFTQYEPMIIGRGIQIDVNGASSLKGLYAAGDEIGNFRADIAGAAVIGRIAGESAGKYSLDAENNCNVMDLAKIDELAEFYGSMMEREKGAKWQELNMAVQQIMNDYAGINVNVPKTTLFWN